MLYSSKGPNLFWSRFAYAGVVFIGPTFYHFTIVFLNIKKQKKFILLAYLTGIVFFITAIFTDLLIIGVKKHFWGYSTLVNPITHSIFLVFFILTYGGALKHLFVEYRREDLRQQQPLEHTRIKYLFLQYAIGAFGGLNYITDWGVNYPPFIGYALVGIGISLVAYAIVRHRLMDITVAFTRTGIFVAVYTLVLGLPFVITASFKDRLISTFGIDWWILPLGLMGVLATIGPFVYIYLDTQAEKRLLHEQHRYQEILKQAAREMARMHNLKKLLSLIVHTLTKTVRITCSGLYLFDPESGQFVLKAGRNLKDAQPRVIERQSVLVEWLEKEKGPVVREEIKRKAEIDADPVFKELEAQMHHLNATIVAPSFLEDKLSYILLLGDKRSGKIYTSEDLGIFSILTSQTALAIENASLYENMEEKVKQRTNELIQTQHQLIQAEKLATVGTLAGGVAHEINNPLAAVLTNTQMLLMDIKDKDQIESLKLIEQATKRCREIVQKLMVYSRKPLGGREVKDVDLQKALNNVISFLNYQLMQENIKLNTKYENPPFIIKGSQNELEQVFTNLILNAKDAIKHLKKSGQIDISITRRSKQIIVKIKDDGIGISKDNLSKIFDPFFTTKDVGKGTGLGLSICQSIIEEHRGSITVESKEGAGSTFMIVFSEKI